MRYWCHKGLSTFVIAAIDENDILSKIIYSTYLGKSVGAVGRDKAYRHEIKEERSTIRFVFEDI